MHQSKESLRIESEPRERNMNTAPSMPSKTVSPPHPTASYPASHRNPFTSPPVALSALPTIHLNSDNPYPSTSTPQIPASDSRGTSGSSTQSSPSVDDISMHPSASTLVAQRTRDVPGEAWIDPLEREGLPVRAPIPNDTGDVLRRRSTWRRGGRDADAIHGEKHIARLAEHDAAGVVRTHTRRGWGRLHRLPDNKNATKSEGAHEGEKGKATEHTRHYRRHTHSDTKNGTDFTDGGFRGTGRKRKRVPGSWLAPVMHMTHHNRQHQSRDHHGPNLGNGVLSALLALYSHDHEHDDEGSASGASTPDGQSRTSSDAGSEEDILPKPPRPWLPDQDGTYDPTSKTQKVGRSLKAGSASSILAHLRSPSLPAASTTAALIAGAGTLSGAAAPKQATLAPNLERPGFNLVRYSMEEVPMTSRRIPNAISRGFHRTLTDSGVATDRHASVEKESETESPDTPAPTIVASPTAGSDSLVHGSKEGQVHPVSTPGGRRGWTSRLKDLPLSMHLSPAHLIGLSSSHPGTPKDKGLHTPGGSGTGTPKTASAGDTPVDEYGEKQEYFDLKHMEREAQRIKEQERKERKARVKRREKEIRRKRKKAEVYVCHLSSSALPVDRNNPRLRGTWLRYFNDRNSS